MLQCAGGAAGREMGQQKKEGNIVELFAALLTSSPHALRGARREPQLPSSLAFGARVASGKFAQL